MVKEEGGDGQMHGQKSCFYNTRSREDEHHLEKPSKHFIKLGLASVLCRGERVACPLLKL